MKTDTQNRLADLHMVYQQSVKYHENRHTKQTCRSTHGLSTKCEIPRKQTHKTGLQIYTWFIKKLLNTMKTDTQNRLAELHMVYLKKLLNTMKTDTQNRLADLYMVYQETIEHHENRHTKQTCRSTHGLP